MKGFFKDISIYGILPVIGKFIGFFLIPIYTRVFNSYEFGIIELILSFFSFIVYFCNLEIYTAIGRFFYEKNTLKEKSVLISTGLWLTVFFTLTVASLFFLLKNQVISYYLDNGKYFKEYDFGVLWVIILALNTYVGVIPRYEKRSKLFVIINIIQIISRVTSTIFFILVLKVGIIGVLYGYIIGETISFCFNLFISWKYLGLSFCWEEAKRINKFAYPLLPSAIFFGLWMPFSRGVVSKIFSVETVGILSFALRITSFMQLINGAVRLAWKPILFENCNQNTFTSDVKKVSDILGLICFSFVFVLTIFSPEISLYVGTQEYIQSKYLIGLLALASGFDILSNVRGYAPFVLNKTYLISLVEIISFFFSISLLILFDDNFGLLGIGVAYFMYPFTRYFCLVLYTKKTMQIKYFNKKEFFLILISIFSILLIFMEMFFVIRLLLFLLILLYLFKEVYKMNLFNKN